MICIVHRRDGYNVPNFMVNFMRNNLSRCNFFCKMHISREKNIKISSGLKSGDATGVEHLLMLLNKGAKPDKLHA